ncbi:MAG: NAD(P)H-dependent oxidoreductase [Sphingomonas sp.]|nr:NAD(P)H-dependent oxidoreductase [Sphingomonas sp.]
MTTLLHIDSSARPGLSGRDARGSHTRRLTRRFLDRWTARAPAARVIARDLAIAPPTAVTGDWVAAAFAKPHRRTAATDAVLAESDALIAELEQADVIVIGAPMYNFGIPSTLKAWIDNVVRIRRTFGFDPSRKGDDLYWPLLPPGKALVIVSARGDGGYAPDGPLAALNLVETSLRVPLGFIGIAENWSVAVEWDEFSDRRVEESLTQAEAEIDALVDRLAARRLPQAA